MHTTDDGTNEPEMLHEIDDRVSDAAVSRTRAALRNGSLTLDPKAPGDVPRVADVITKFRQRGH